MLTQKRSFETQIQDVEETTKHMLPQKKAFKTIEVNNKQENVRAQKTSLKIRIQDIEEATKDIIPLKKLFETIKK